MFHSFLQSFLCSGSRKTEVAEDLSPKAPSRFKFQAKVVTEEGSCDTTSQNRKYLVLDLDETLIHTRDTPYEKDIPSLHFRTSRSKTKFYVAIRPHLIEFLEEMSQLYTIVIFTASSKEYAEAMIKRLNIGKYINRLFHREDCMSKWHGVSKNLSILGVPLKDVVLVDDSLGNAYYQPENFLLIEYFEGQKNDKTLLKLIPFLKGLAALDDLRNVDSHYAKYTARLKAEENQEPKVSDDIADQMKKPECSNTEHVKEEESPSDSDKEPNSVSVLPSASSDFEDKPKGSLFMRKARGFYASLIRAPVTVM